VPGSGHGKFGNCGNRLWKDLEVAVQSGSGKVAVGGRCAAVGVWQRPWEWCGQMWQAVEGGCVWKWPWEAAVLAVESGRGKVWQWLCKDPERAVGGRCAAR
jgi:hypothetical protein